MNSSISYVNDLQLQVIIDICQSLFTSGSSFCETLPFEWNPKNEYNSSIFSPTLKEIGTTEKWLKQRKSLKFYHVSSYQSKLASAVRCAYKFEDKLIKEIRGKNKVDELCLKTEGRLPTSSPPQVIRKQKQKSITVLQKMRELTLSGDILVKGDLQKVLSWPGTGRRRRRLINIPFYQYDTLRMNSCFSSFSKQQPEGGRSVRRQRELLPSRLSFTTFEEIFCLFLSSVIPPPSLFRQHNRKMANYIYFVAFIYFFL